jgi:hypothetical protein
MPTGIVPRQSFPKTTKVSIGGVCWKKLELIFGRTPTDCRPSGGNPAQRFRSPDGEQNRKIFSSFFNGAPPKFFSIKEKKIFLFCLPADAGIAVTLSLPQPRLAGQSKRAKIPPTPFLFARLLAGFARFFLRTGYKLKKVTGGLV